MNKLSPDELQAYYREAETWSHDREREISRSRKIAWVVAGLVGAIALVEAIALAALIPLKREVPYTLLVDRQTGYVESLRPLDQATITADAALTRSFLVQYVIARESFDIDRLAEDYRKVALWSAGDARERYIALMQPNNPLNPAVYLPRRSSVTVQIRSISSLNAKTSLVRYSTVRTDPGGRPQPAEHWVSLLTWGYSTADMSAEDRLVNPLGFQVTRYRKDPEALPNPGVQDPAVFQSGLADPERVARVPMQ